MSPSFLNEKPRIAKARTKLMLFVNILIEKMNALVNKEGFSMRKQCIFEAFEAAEMDVNGFAINS